MRILLLLFVSIHFAFSQGDPLFKIISCSEGVTLDGNEVIPGQIVYSNSIKLEIPKKGFAGVMTTEGYAAILTKSFKAKLVNWSIEYANRETRSSAVIATVPWFTIPGQFSNQFSYISGDSVFFGFKANYKMDSPITAKFLTMFDEVVLSDTIESNWKVFNVNKLLENEAAILFELSSNTFTSEKILLVKIKKELLMKVKFEIARIQDDLIAKLALYELNDLYHDHLFQLYKIETTKNLNLDLISTAYLAKRREKYQLHQYNLK